MKKTILLFFLLTSLAYANNTEIYMDNDSIILSEGIEEQKEFKLFNKDYILTKNLAFGELIYEKIKQYSIEFEVDPDLIVALIEVESQFNVDVESPVGAVGLMQLMPGTANEMGIKDPWDISQNIYGGIKYLNYCLKQTKGDVPLALASYNAGYSAVKKYNGIPPYDETLTYVNKILKILDKNLDFYAYSEIKFKKSVENIFLGITFKNADSGEI